MLVAAASTPDVEEYLTDEVARALKGGTGNDIHIKSWTWTDSEARVYHFDNATE